MREFLVRLLYFGVILCLYFVGQWLSAPNSGTVSTSIDLKILLPLFSIVFLEYWVRSFSSIFYRWKLVDHRYERDTLLLDFRLLHKSQDPCYYEYVGLSGVACERLTLSYRKGASTDVHCCPVPQNCAITLNREVSAAFITLRALAGVFSSQLFRFRLGTKFHSLSLVAVRLRSNGTTLTNWCLVRSVRKDHRT